MLTGKRSRWRTRTSVCRLLRRAGGAISHRNLFLLAAASLIKGLQPHHFCLMSIHRRVWRVTVGSAAKIRLLLLQLLRDFDSFGRFLAFSQSRKEYAVGIVIGK
jgi:hypothetical protein